MCYVYLNCIGPNDNKIAIRQRPWPGGHTCKRTYKGFVDLRWKKKWHSRGLLTTLWMFVVVVLANEVRNLSWTAHYCTSLLSPEWTDLIKFHEQKLSEAIKIKWFDTISNLTRSTISCKTTNLGSNWFCYRHQKDLCWWEIYIFFNKCSYSTGKISCCFYFEIKQTLCFHWKSIHSSKENKRWTYWRLEILSDWNQKSNHLQSENNLCYWIWKM